MKPAATSEYQGVISTRCRAKPSSAGSSVAKGETFVDTAKTTSLVFIILLGAAIILWFLTFYPKPGADYVPPEDFDRIVVSHGEVLEHGGPDALRAAFEWL